VQTYRALNLHAKNKNHMGNKGMKLTRIKIGAIKSYDAFYLLEVKISLENIIKSRRVIRIFIVIAE
jgi:hypothetical protein